MSKKKILIYDDDPSTVTAWQQRLDNIPALTKTYDIEALGDADLQEEIKNLEERREGARSRARRRVTTEALFDNAAILILDYDLLKLKRDAYLTGETIAYLARCYSRCGLIIGLNQFGDNPFDLTLKGHPESYADLNIGSSQLDNPGLWTESWKGFRPWYWPVLPHALASFERRIKQLAGRLNTRILAFLGIEPYALTLPRSTIEFITREKDVARTTFEDFVKHSGNGLRRKDKAISEEWLQRIAAARIAKWLERFVLSGQDLLVDAPHLVSRYPSLIVGDKKKLTSWNRTVSLRDMAQLGIHHRKITAFKFKKEDWLSRPAWLWPEVSKCEKIDEVSDPWKMERPDCEFCEDVSRFLPRDAVRGFVADLPSPFAGRFVVEPSKAAQPLGKELKKVDYRPRVRFSL